MRDTSVAQMFTTAIVYAKEIMNVSNMLHGIREAFERYDAAPPVEVLDAQVRVFGNRTDDVPKLFGPLYDRRIANLTWKMRWSRRIETLLGLFSARAARAAAALAKGIVAMRRIHRAFPHFSHTPYRFDAAPNAVHAWDAGFDVRAYATHGVMHGVYHYLLRGPVPPPEYPYVS